jgi:hypothetical protein
LEPVTFKLILLHGGTSTHYVILVKIIQTLNCLGIEAVFAGTGGVTPTPSVQADQSQSAQTPGNENNHKCGC